VELQTKSTCSPPNKPDQLSHPLELTAPQTDHNMSRFNRRVQIPDLQLPKYDDAEEEGDYSDNNGVARLTTTGSNVSDDQEPVMGVKVLRQASRHRDIKGDYLDVPSHSYLMKIFQKQGQSISPFQVLITFLGIFCFLTDN